MDENRIDTEDEDEDEEGEKGRGRAKNTGEKTGDDEGGERLRDQRKLRTGSPWVRSRQACTAAASLGQGVKPEGYEKPARPTADAPRTDAHLLFRGSDRGTNGGVL